MSLCIYPGRNINEDTIFQCSKFSLLIPKSFIQRVQPIFNRINVNSAQCQESVMPTTRKCTVCQETENSFFSLSGSFSLSLCFGVTNSVSVLINCTRHQNIPARTYLLGHCVLHFYPVVSSSSAQNMLFEQRSSVM